MTKIKICGLKSLADIEYVNKYQPEYIGFVFANSKRKVDDKTAATLKAALDDKIQAVGVFVNEPIEHVVNLCRNKTIDLIQLHGDEEEDYIKKLKEQVSNNIIKAVRVQSREQIEKMQDFPCDYLLLDTYSKNQYGGSGLSFDRSFIPKQCNSFFLAGGLEADNILPAISDCNPYCVDISSGVETDGIKDEIKIRDIIQRIRKTD